MSNHIDRRGFLVSVGAAAGAAATAGLTGGALGAVGQSQAGGGGGVRARRAGRVCAISSANGVRTVARAVERIREGVDPLLAAVEGVGIVEADPDDLTVGLGGRPNELGIVELDASVMHGPTHKAGSVASIQNIMHPAQVAMKVLQYTDHVMIVGEGAKKFAISHGFKEEDLLTEEARRQWIQWKRHRSEIDDWLTDSQMDWKPDGSRPLTDTEKRAEIEERSTGTIHCSAVTPAGDCAGCTTTSGLAYKIPGRVGDSPIIGAGLFTDNEVGSAGATGRGEEAIQSCGAHSVVMEMANGKDPTEACLAVLKKVADRVRRQRRLVDERGRPNFNLVFYAVRKDGAYGSACMIEGREFAVDDGNGARREKCAFLFEAR